MTLHYIYFYSLLITIIPWMISFVYFKKNRKEILVMSSILGLAAFCVANYSISDYWHPQYVIPGFYLEDFMYGFFVGGFAVSIAHLFARDSKAKHHKNYIFIFLSFIITLTVVKLFTGYFVINSIYAYLVVMFLIGLLVSIFDYRKIKQQLIVSLLTLIYTMIMYNIIELVSPNFVHNNFKLENISGLVYLNVPLEEIIFALLLGYSVSLFYETGEGIRLRKNTKINIPNMLKLKDY